MTDPTAGEREAFVYTVNLATGEFGTTPATPDAGDPRRKVIADMLKRFSHPRAYAGDYFGDFADRILRALDALPAGEHCPTPCDDDCATGCHEAHAVDWKRQHQPEECLSATPDAGDVLEATTLLLADPRFHGPHLTWDGPTVRVLLQTVAASDWFAAQLDAARAEEGKRIAQAIRALPTMGKFAPGVWVVRESAARIAEESR